MKKIINNKSEKTSAGRYTAAFMAAVMVLTGVTLPGGDAEAAEAEYEIYPSPQVISYEGDSYIINNDVNVVYEDGIDAETRARLDEVFALKSDISVTVSDEIVEGRTNVLVGIDGSEGYVDRYVEENIDVTDDGLFDKLDAYVLDSSNNVITVLGADTDASFYGLTTLYHIIKQMDSYTIRSFHIEDWADVASRGFIEGYYGNPWSTQDRINLMKWGGYYKLNSYFYAPKNDPKHNAQWRTLYTEQELDELIRPLAEAGNDSKCRFVYALHTFMNSPVRFDSNYESDLAAVQAKFEQVIEAGVKQIAILADDAGNVGSDNYVRFLNDMTEWLAGMGEKYPDLKQTLPFCTVEYMGNGQSYYQNFPENVQIVMTGGKVWGEVSDKFTTTFYNNAGRGPYMWVNWPCTDNSKNHLIMGGYSTFLHPGVDPDKIQGIVLNPMQQSEPSKTAIFGNACYSWNIWQSEEEAEQIWQDSFKYVDHNSSIETDASNALKELSKHMINQNMDSKVTALQESTDLAPALTEFRNKLNNNTVTAEDADALIEQFKILQDAADTYEASGNEDIKAQIIYWLDCWDDTADAAIAYLNGVKAVLDNDTTAVIQYNTDGKTAFDSSRTHEFWYLDHYEYAEVGVQHIVPFIKAVGEYVSRYAETAMDPDAVIRSFITNRTDNPAGSTENVFDGNDETMASYRNPVWIKTGDYVGVLYNKVIEIRDIRFLLGTGKNHFEASKLQYTMDGEEWQDLDLAGMDNAFTGIENQYLDIVVKQENLPEDFKAMGIRLVAAADNVKDAYLNVHEIQINSNADQEQEGQERYTGTVTYNGMSVRNSAGEANYFDGSDSTEVQLAKGPYEQPDRDKIAEGASLTVTFDEPKTVGSFRLVQGISDARDVFSNADAEYQLDGSTEWVKAGTIGSEKDQTIDFGIVENVKAVRILNREATYGWVRIAEIEILPPQSGADIPIQYNVIRTDRWTVHQGSEANLYDGNDDTYVWYDPDGSGNTTGDDFMVDDFLGYDLGKIADLMSAHIVVGHDGSDKLMKYAVEISVDGTKWSAVNGYENYEGAASGKDTLDIDLTGTKARYIRIRNLERRGSWGKFSEFTVKEQVRGSSEYVYTNIDTAVSSSADEGIVSLSEGTVTLNKDDYIGVKLDHIKAVTGVTASELPENTVLEVSMNGIEWVPYRSDDTPVDARYIRIRGTADSVKFKLTQFDVEYEFVGKKSVESDFAMAQTKDDMRSAGTAGNVFDGDLSTIGMINGAQEAGKHITFDLGQVIHFSSLRYYIIESQLNYLRNADFEVSVDGSKWTKVLHVGQETENKFDSTTAKDMQGITLTHDAMNPGYMYAEAAGLDADGRYIRVTPVETYSHRWVGFNEIQINGGAYISTEANRDVISEAVEERGKLPSNMLDGDYSTTYRSSEENSSFTYRLSEPEGKASIRIIQSGAVSNAEVTARYIGEDKPVSLGKLNQAINEYIIPEGKTLKSITVEWADKIPEIAEIGTSEDRSGAADKTKLEEALKQTADDAWTTNSKEKYQAAWDVANEIYNNENVSQTVVDSALGSLQSAFNNAEKKASNIEELQAIADGKADNENMIYSGITYNAYESAVDKLAAALKNADNLSQEEADRLKADVESAEAALEYSTRNRELAVLETLRYDAVNGDNYTTESYDALTAAKEAIDTLAAQDTAAENGEGERVDPQKFIDARAAFQKAMDGLVDVTALKEVLAQAESVDSSLYTEESYQAYAAAVEKGKALLANGTADAAADAVEDIKAAYEALTLKPDTTLADAVAAAEELLQAEGAEDKYTADSYNALAAIVEEAKQNGDDSYIEKIQTAVKELVDVTALRTQIEAAKSVDADSFTISSHKVLSDLLGQTEELLKSGSREDIAAAAEAIENAIRSLVPRAEGVEDYRDSITLKPEQGYTADSYKVYKEAYEALMSTDPSDLSAEQFARLKADFEKAELALKAAGGADSQTGNGQTGNSQTGNGQNGSGDRTDKAVQTGDTSNPAVWALCLIASAGAAGAILRRRSKK